MLSFFRRIRKGLLEINQVKKYLLYALGEIALVVIGILIALQINNWNEERIKKKSEVGTLIALKSEFSANQTIISTCLNSLKDQKLENDSLMFHMGPNAPLVSKDKFQRWIWAIGDTPTCKLSSDVIEDIRSSGRLSLISNEEVRLAIGAWSSSVADMKQEEIEFSADFTSQFMPYTNAHISWATVDRVGFDEIPRDLLNANFEYDHSALLKQMEFANIINQHGWRMGNVLGKYQIILEQINGVLEKIDIELN